MTCFSLFMVSLGKENSKSTFFSFFKVSVGKENSESTMKLEKNGESGCECKLPGIFKEFLS